MAQEITNPRENLFLCSRTSIYQGKPCEEAFMINVINIDTRDTNDAKLVPAYKGNDKWWYERGTNHRIEDDKIKRDLGTKEEWAVEIDNIMDFIKKYGSCVISEEDNYLAIEIYDDYRE